MAKPAADWRKLEKSNSFSYYYYIRRCFGITNESRFRARERASRGFSTSSHFIIIYCELLIVINLKCFVSHFAQQHFLVSASSLAWHTIFFFHFSRWLCGRTDKRGDARGTSLSISIYNCMIRRPLSGWRKLKHRFRLTHLLQWKRLFHSPTKRTITKRWELFLVRPRANVMKRIYAGALRGYTIVCSFFHLIYRVFPCFCVANKMNQI